MRNGFGIGLAALLVAGLAYLGINAVVSESQRERDVATAGVKLDRILDRLKVLLDKDDAQDDKETAGLISRLRNQIALLNEFIRSLGETPPSSAEGPSGAGGSSNGGDPDKRESPSPRPTDSPPPPPPPECTVKVLDVCVEA